MMHKLIWRPELWFFSDYQQPSLTINWLGLLSQLLLLLKYTYVWCFPCFIFLPSLRPGGYHTNASFFLGLHWHCGNYISHGYIRFLLPTYISSLHHPIIPSQVSSFCFFPKFYWKMEQNSLLFMYLQTTEVISICMFSEKFTTPARVFPL